jgi:hypothetical protein
MKYKKKTKLPVALWKPKVKITWFPDEILYLRENYKNTTNDQLLEHINSNRPEGSKIMLGAMRHELARLGCLRMTQDRWNGREIKFLKKNFTIMGDVEIANHLTALSYAKRKFTRRNIQKKRDLLGLHRTSDQVARILQDNIICGTQNTVSKSWDTMGRASEQEVRIWNCNGRLQRRIKINGTFIPYSRWNYEQKVGPVPEGMLVFHRDGDSLNDTTENYILVKEENRIAMLQSYRKKCSGSTSPLDQLVQARDEEKYFNVEENNKFYTF